MIWGFLICWVLSGLIAAIAGLYFHDGKFDFSDGFDLEALQIVALNIPFGPFAVFPTLSGSDKANRTIIEALSKR